MISPSIPVRRAVVVLAVALVYAAAVRSLAAVERRHAGRLRAVAIAAAPSEPDPARALVDGPSCAVAETSRAGARVTALLEGADGELWIGTAGRGVLRGGAPGFAPEPVTGLAGRQLVVAALALHDGLVWAATQGGLVALDGDRRALAVLEGEPVAALAATRGALYAGTARGLFRVSVDEGAERVDLAGPAGEPLRPTALAISGERLWIGTDAGAYVIPLASLDAPLLARTAAWIPLVSAEPPADTNAVTALAPFEDGALAGTDGGGLVLLRADASASALRFADAGANAVSAGAAAAAPGGAALAGTRGGGLLAVRAGAAGPAVERVGAIGRREVSAVAAAAQGAVAGTADGAVLRIACAGAVPAS